MTNTSDRPLKSLPIPAQYGKLDIKPKSEQ